MWGTHLAVWWVLYPILVCQVALSPCRWASALDSVCWGISWADSISMGVYSGCWVVAMGRWAVLWVFRQFCGHFHGLLVIIQGLHLQWGVDLGGGCICCGMVGLVMCHPGLKATSQPKPSPLRPSSVKPLQGLVWPVAQASLLQSCEPWLCAADNEVCKQLLW